MSNAPIENFEEDDDETKMLADIEQEVLAAQTKPAAKRRGRPPKNSKKVYATEASKMQDAVNSMDPMDPVAQFIKLGFDPLAASIFMIREVDKRLKWMMSQSKPAMQAISALMGVKERLISNMMKYGYKTIGDRADAGVISIPLSITLTDRPISDLKIEKTVDLPKPGREVRH
jgi:hypothetical protein